MVKVKFPSASVWVEDGNYSVNIDLSDFLVEAFLSDPKTLKKLLLEGLKKKRREYLDQLSELKEKQKKLKLICEVIDTITSTDEFKKKLAEYLPEERRKIRRMIKTAVGDATGLLDYYEYELESTATSLNRIRKIIEILENTDPDLIETEF